MIIDTDKWEEFTISKLFDIHPTKAYKITNKDLFEDDGKNPVIVNSGFNNGVGGYTNSDCTEEKGIITFTDTAAKSTDSFFYQANDFVGYPHVQGMYALNHEWTENESLFLISVIKAKIANKYDFIEKMTRMDILNLVIKLPIISPDVPDWNYMNEYIESIKNKAKVAIKNCIKAYEYSEKRVDVSRFKRFHLYDDDLFIVDSGSKLDKVRMKDNAPSVNFVGRANANNGVTDFIDRIEGLEPYKAGYMTISLGGEYLGSCFIQDKPFYTSQNVNVLIPKREMSYYQKQYIATMVFREGRLHYKAFIDELNRHMKTDFTIPLPVKDDESIDWEYMESYMKFIEEKGKGIINTLI